MTYRELAVPAGLAAYVRRVWYLDLPRVRPYEKILPLPFVHVIGNLSAPYRLFHRDGTVDVVDDAFVSGIQSEYLVIESPEQIRHVGAELHPDALRAFSTEPATAVAGRVRAAEAVLPGMSALVAALRARRADPDTALAALTDFLAATKRELRPDPVTTTVLAMLDGDPHARIGDLAAAAGVTHMTLIAHVTRACGLAPKRYAEVIRFHRFVTGLPIDGEMPSWAELAAASSYYDQPHVIRAFRRFSGTTPSEYLERVREFGADAASFVPLDEVPGGDAAPSRR